MDADGSCTISENELAHVLTRIEGSHVDSGKAQSLLRMADVNHDGEIQFEEFKEIVTKSAPIDDWGKAAQAVGAPAALLAAGRASAAAVDGALAGTHAAMQAGAPSATLPGLGGYSVPTVATRMFGEFMMMIPYSIAIVCSCTQILFYELFVLFPRGQTFTLWMLGMQYIDPRTGHPAGFMSVFLRGWFSNLLHACTASITLWVDIFVGCTDPNSQTMVDKGLGVLLVYRNPNVVPQPLNLQAAPVPTRAAAPPPPVNVNTTNLGEAPPSLVQIIIARAMINGIIVVALVCCKIKTAEQMMILYPVWVIIDTIVAYNQLPFFIAVVFVIGSLQIIDSVGITGQGKTW